MRCARTSPVPCGSPKQSLPIASQANAGLGGPAHWHENVEKGPGMMPDRSYVLQNAQGLPACLPPRTGNAAGCSSCTGSSGLNPGPTSRRH
jgi:hypothetical protein